VAPLRRKGRMTKLQLERRAAHEALRGRRPSGSSKAVRKVLETLAPVVPKCASVVLDSDLAHRPERRPVMPMKPPHKGFRLCLCHWHKLQHRTSTSRFRLTGLPSSRRTPQHFNLFPPIHSFVFQRFRP
jgi:hypothetical protein